MLSPTDIKMNLTPSLPTGRQTGKVIIVQHDQLATRAHVYIETHSIRSTGFGAKASGIETWFLYCPADSKPPVRGGGEADRRCWGRSAE